MLDTPQITRTSWVRSAVIRVTIPRTDIQQAMGAGIQELMSTLAAQGVAPGGPWYTHHLRMDPDVFDFEIGVPISAPVTPKGRVRAGELPAARVARVVYRGGYEGLGNAWGEFEKWLAAEGHKPRPDLWEVYVAGPETSADPAEWRTELNRPLEG